LLTEGTAPADLTAAAAGLVVLAAMTMRGEVERDERGDV